MTTRTKKSASVAPELKSVLPWFDDRLGIETSLLRQALTLAVASAKSIGGWTTDIVSYTEISEHIDNFAASENFHENAVLGLVSHGSATPSSLIRTGIADNRINLILKGLFVIETAFGRQSLSAYLQENTASQLGPFSTSHLKKWWIKHANMGALAEQLSESALDFVITTMAACIADLGRCTALETWLKANSTDSNKPEKPVKKRASRKNSATPKTEVATSDEIERGGFVVILDSRYDTCFFLGKDSMTLSDQIMYLCKDLPDFESSSFAANWHGTGVGSLEDSGLFFDAMCDEFDTRKAPLSFIPRNLFKDLSLKAHNTEVVEANLRQKLKEFNAQFSAYQKPIPPLMLDELAAITGEDQFGVYCAIAERIVLTCTYMHKDKRVHAVSVDHIKVEYACGDFDTGHIDDKNSRVFRHVFNEWLGHNAVSLDLFVPEPGYEARASGNHKDIDTALRQCAQSYQEVFDRYINRIQYASEGERAKAVFESLLTAEERAFLDL